jgi:beta-aspartyl-peptidase (threonine type)
MNRSPILLIHGGAWDIPPDLLDAHEQGVFDALQEGWRILDRGGSALDAVETAVTSLENDPAFDAGRGSFLTRAGRVQLDALIMDGATLRAGGVACVERIRNPIQAARLVLDKSHHVYFVGPGAEEFAARHGADRKLRAGAGPRAAAPCRGASPRTDGRSGPDFLRLARVRQP